MHTQFHIIYPRAILDDDDDAFKEKIDWSKRDWLRIPKGSFSSIFVEAINFHPTSKHGEKVKLNWCMWRKRGRFFWFVLREDIKFPSSFFFKCKQNFNPFTWFFIAMCKSQVEHYVKRHSQPLLMHSCTFVHAYFSSFILFLFLSRLCFVVNEIGNRIFNFITPDPLRAHFQTTLSWHSTQNNSEKKNLKIHFLILLVTITVTE